MIDDNNGLPENTDDVLTDPVTDDRSDPVSEEESDTVFFPEFIRSGAKEKNGFFATFFEGVDVLVSAMVAVIVIFVFVFKIPTIEGSSMNDTLFDGERVVISNLFYEPEYGDIVVISRNYTNDSEGTDRSATPIIKRVIATEGQTVDIDFQKGVVYVDSVALDEPYTRTPTNRSYPGMDFPVTVPENCVFVLGDNRNDSLDSRAPSIGDHGMIDKRYILGKALFIASPFSRFGKIEKD